MGIKQFDTSMMSVVKKITQFYMRKGKKQGHEYSHTLCRHTPKPKTETLGSPKQKHTNTKENQTRNTNLWQEKTKLNN